MTPELLAKLAEQYPFITLCVYSSVEYVGIVQNHTDTITTIYDFGEIVGSDEKKSFIDLANVWWWESNRTIPINIFLKGDWDKFRPYLKTFVNKDLQILHGPVCSLTEMARKRSKKKSIMLVKRIN